MKELIKKNDFIYKILKFIKNSITSIYKCLRYLYYYLFVRDLVYHFGVFGEKENVGDVILYSKMEGITDMILGQDLKWYNRHIHRGEVSKWEVILINKIAKVVVIGGHGLLMIDTNKNDNSGWQFNISLRNLKQIKVPIVTAAIGYNKFRNQNDFANIFEDHISYLVEYAVFFGLRNYGSIEALKKHIPEKLHAKLKFQPCPTTIVNQFYPTIKDIEVSNSKKIGICVAFDRLDKRFGGKHEDIFSTLLRYAARMKKEGYQIQFFAHNQYDVKCESIKYFEQYDYEILPLFTYNEEEVYEFYKEFALIAGMRGHSLMIPFGAGIPIISLTTQNKQKWFIETLGRPEWSIEVETDFEDSLYSMTQNILSHFEETKLDIEVIQKKLSQITKRNVLLIKNEIC